MVVFIYTRGGSFVNFNNDNNFLLYTRAHTHTRPRQKKKITNLVRALRRMSKQACPLLLLLLH